MMSGEFLTQLYNTFDYIPDRYRLDISVSFRNPEGYSEERLEVIFRKNMILALRIISQEARRRNRLVLILRAIGLLFILLAGLFFSVVMSRAPVFDV